MKYSTMLLPDFLNKYATKTEKNKLILYLLSHPFCLFDEHGKYISVFESALLYPSTNSFLLLHFVWEDCKIIHLKENYFVSFTEDNLNSLSDGEYDELLNITTDVISCNLLSDFEDIRKEILKITRLFKKAQKTYPNAEKAKAYEDSFCKSVMNFSPQLQDIFFDERLPSLLTYWQYLFWESALERYQNKRTKGYVYLIQNKKTKSVKIGYSIEPHNRVKNLQTASEFELKLIAFKEGTMQDEYALKQRFIKFLIKNEWYRFADPIAMEFGLIP